MKTKLTLEEKALLAIAADYYRTRAPLPLDQINSLSQAITKITNQETKSKEKKTDLK